MFRITCPKKFNTAFLTSLILIAGCATTPMATLRVKVADNGLITINNKPISLDNVGASVKRAGAKRDTMIEVIVPAKATQDLCQSLKNNIAGAGFPNIFFVRQKQSTAYVNKDSDSKGLKKSKITVPKILKR